MPQRIVTVPARRFTRFVNRPQVQAAFGVLLICVSLVVAYLAKQSYEDNRDAARQARAQCLRTQRLSPPLLAFFHSFDGDPKHAIDPKTLRVYDATVPKTCPN